MTVHSSLLNTLEMTSDQGKWYVAVPWEHADAVHDYFTRREWASTLCLNPASREARLELAGELDPQRVLAGLRENDPSSPPKQAA